MEQGIEEQKQEKARKREEEGGNGISSGKGIRSPCFKVRDMRFTLPELIPCSLQNCKGQVTLPYEVHLFMIQCMFMVCA
jgi:hypothetical protein